MNAHTPPQQVAEAETASTDLVLVTASPVAVLTDPVRFEQFYEQVKAETDKIEIDLTTDAGRKAIASMAYKVAQTKTAIDNAGKKLTEDARAKIATVNASRKTIWDKLEALQAEVRRPLTEWEEAEKKRKTLCAEIMDRLAAVTVVTIEDTAESVGARLAEIEALQLDEATFQEGLSMATGMRANAVSLLTAAVARLQKEEADRAELERLRAEAAERAAKEQAEQEAREAEERARQERNAYGLAIIQHIKDVGMGMIGGAPYPYPILIRELEEKVEIDDRLGDHQDEARALLAATLETVKARMAEAMERDAREAEAEKAKAAAEAADKAKRDAEEAAAAERRRQEQAHAAELARVQKEKDDLLAAQQAEEKRKADEAAAERKRAADREHQGKVMSEAKAALMQHCELTEEAAKRVVLAIRGELVPHVTLKF